MKKINSNLDTIDFANLYRKQKEASSFKIKSEEDWNAKAESMNQGIHQSMYVEQFLERIKLSKDDTLIDMGCGPGTIALRAAPFVKQVFALDYSQKMLDCVQENAARLGLTNIVTVKKAWEDDWQDVPICDITIASRALEVLDVKAALTKLIEKTRKHSYFTFMAAKSFLQHEILLALDRKISAKPDYIYLVNILYQMGILAKIDFIESEDYRFIASNAEEFIEKVTWSIGELSMSEKISLQNFFNSTELFKKKENSARMLWAFISFDV